MKKIIVALLLICISSSMLFAYSNPKLERGLNMAASVIEKKYSFLEQEEKYSRIVNALKPMLDKVTGKQKQNFQLIITWAEERLSILSKNGNIKPTINKNKKNNYTEDNWNAELKTQKSIIQDREQQTNLSKVDIVKIQKTWLDWHNKERRQLWLPNYILHDKLNYSAFTWAKHLSGVWTWSHKRKTTDGFYNYDSIKERFDNLDIKFSGKWTLFSESIALGSFSCKKSDCTDNLIRGMKKNFNFFMSEEKYKENRKKPHYRAIVHSYFNMIGVWIYQKGWKYYLVAHYGRSVK